MSCTMRTSRRIRLPLIFRNRQRPAARQCYSAFLHGQHAQGDRHVYASRTRFIPDRLLGLFERTSWPLAVAGAGVQGKTSKTAALTLS
jgi:hypothetical protein